MKKTVLIYFGTLIITTTLFAGMLYSHSGNMASYSNSRRRNLSEETAKAAKDGVCNSVENFDSSKGEIVT